MRRNNRVAAAPAALLLLALAGPAMAQPVPDPGIDQRVRAFGRTGQTASEAEEEALLTGRDDILLMRQRRFFTIAASAGGGYTDNAGLSPTMRQADGYFSGDASLRIATQLGGLVDVYAEAGVSTTRYFQQTGLDLVAVFGAVGAHVAVKGFDLDVGYTPNMVWDGDLETRQLTQHRFVASVGRGFRVGRGLVRATIGGERIEANPSAFQNFAATAGVSGVVPVAPGVAVIGSVRGVRRWYDNYFEGLLGVERRDWFLEGAAGLSWRLHRNVSLDARLTYAKNWSTADISRYEAANGAAIVRVAFEF